MNKLKANYKNLVIQRAPEGTRTPNLLIRSQMLYPIGLRVPNVESIYRINKIQDICLLIKLI